MTNAGPSVVVPTDRHEPGCPQRRISDHARRWWSVWLFLVVGLVVTLDPPYTNTPPIRSDGLGYHGWTRAILDGNISFCPYTDLEPVAALIRTTPGGRCGNKYPPGLALLRLPIMAPFTAANHGELRSPAEDRVNQLMSLAAGVAAMSTAIAAARKLGVGDGISNFSTAAVMFGTNQFHFATYDSSFTHIYSAAIVGGLTLLSVRLAGASGTMSRGGSVLVAALTFFLVDIRMLLVAPLTAAGGVLAVHLVRTGGLHQAVVKYRRPVLAAAVGSSIALLQQLLENRYIFGNWRLSSYAGEDFMWSQGKQLHVLFSFQKGALLWSPMMVVAIAATILARRFLIAALLAVTIGTLAMIYGAWHAWGLGGGFGHRGFVEVTPLCAIAVGLACARFRPTSRAGLFTASTASIVITLGLMRGYWTGDIGFDGGTAQQYISFSVGSDSFLVHYLSIL